MLIKIESKSALKIECTCIIRDQISSESDEFEKKMENLLSFSTSVSCRSCNYE